MISNNITTSYAPTSRLTDMALKTSPANAALFQSMLQSQSPALQGAANSAFGIGSVGTKSLITPIQTHNTNNSKTLCISDYYKVSCEEILPTLQALWQRIDDANLNTMSDVEKYDLIENLFIEAFGEDFLIADTLKLPGSQNELGKLNYMHIGSAFYSALYRELGSDTDIKQVNRQRLYGNMETADIQNTIRNKYPKKLSNRELFLMLSEMKDSGVNNYIIGDANYISATIYPQSQNENHWVFEMNSDDWYNRWAEALDKPADISIYTGMWNVSLRSASGPSYYAYEERDFLINFLGAKLRSDGLFVSSYYDEYLALNKQK